MPILKVESAPRPIQSISCDVYLFVLCLFIPSCRSRNRMDWRLLVKELIGKMEKLRNPFLEGFDNLLGFE